MYNPVRPQLRYQYSPKPDPVVGVTAKVVLENHQGDLVVVRVSVRLRGAFLLADPRRQIDAGIALVG